MLVERVAGRIMCTQGVFVCVCVYEEGQITAFSRNFQTTNNIYHMWDCKLGKNGIEPWYSNCNLQNPGVPQLTFMCSARTFPLK
jgi:hypothetical protein